MRRPGMPLEGRPLIDLVREPFLDSRRVEFSGTFTVAGRLRTAIQP